MEILKPYRQRIDDLDDRIIDLLDERTAVIREVGHLKTRQNIPAILQDRVDEVRERNAARAAALGVDADMISEVYRIIIDYSCDLEEQIKQGKAA